MKLKECADNVRTALTWMVVMWLLAMGVGGAIGFGIRVAKWAMGDGQ